MELEQNPGDPSAKASATVTGDQIDAWCIAGKPMSWLLPSERPAPPLETPSQEPAEFEPVLRANLMTLLRRISQGGR